MIASANDTSIVVSESAPDCRHGALSGPPGGVRASLVDIGIQLGLLPADLPIPSLDDLHQLEPVARRPVDPGERSRQLGAGWKLVQSGRQRHVLDHTYERSPKTAPREGPEIGLLDGLATVRTSRRPTQRHPTPRSQPRILTIGQDIVDTTARISVPARYHAIEGCMSRAPAKSNVC